MLDAHASSRHLGRPLASAGHDVLALNQDQDLAALTDDEVLELATQQRRVVITHDVADFARLAHERAEAGRSHAGCILITVPTTAYGRILRGLLERSADLPRQEDWTDRVEFLAAETNGQ